jgi:Tfp pilus assembly protein PilO
MSPIVYFITLGAFFGTVLVVFGMKYLSAAAVAGAEGAQAEAYHKLAANAVTAQSGNAATLSAIQSELAEIETRMASVEKILKEVG